MKDEDEEYQYEHDLSKMVARIKMDEEEQEERARVAPNMEAGGSHSQAMSDPAREGRGGRGSGMRATAQ